MNNSRKRQSFSSCSLVQTDIFTAFNKWKNSISKKNKNKMSLKTGFISSAVVIEIDSDSEQIAEDTNQITDITVKRELPFPFSDNEDEENEDLQEDGSGRSCIPTTPRKITQIVVNRPVASSTPHSFFDSSINLTHVGINDLSTILNKECDTISKAGSLDSISTETTIICETKSNQSKNKSKIDVIENLIISPSCNTNHINVMPTPEKPTEPSTDRISNNVPKKRVSETERAYKRQKVNVGNKKQLIAKILEKEKESLSPTPKRSTQKIDTNGTTNNLSKKMVSESKKACKRRKVNGDSKKQLIAKILEKKKESLSSTPERSTQKIYTNGTTNNPVRKMVSESEKACKQRKVNNKKQVTKKTSEKSKENKCGQSLSAKCNDISKQILNCSDHSDSSELSVKNVSGKLQQPSTAVIKHASKQIKPNSKYDLCSLEVENNQNDKCPSTSSVKEKLYCSDDVTKNLNDKIKSGGQSQVITPQSNKDLTKKNSKDLKRNESSEESMKTVNKEKKSEIWLSKASLKDEPKQTLNSSNFTHSEERNIRCCDKSKQKSSSNKNVAQTGHSEWQKNICDNNGNSLKNIPNMEKPGHSSKGLEGPSLKAKIEDKKVNLEYLKLITELFKTVYETKYLKNLLIRDKQKVEEFFEIKKEYQYVCLKLFTWQRKWYNVFKFCRLVKLNIADSDVCDLYNTFKEKQIVDTDYTKDDILALLNLLDKNDLKSICETFKLNKCVTTKKEDMINGLLKYCKTQSTLTIQKSTYDLIKEEIIRKMGKCIRLNENFHDVFYRTYVLGTFTNPAFTNMTDYFKNMLHLKILFPTYPVQDYLVFYTEEEFIRFARAKKCCDELDKTMGDHLESLIICKTMFKELVALKDIQDTTDDRYRDAPHLIRFTARAVYVSGLSSAVKILATKFPVEVKEWLEYMIKNETRFPHRFGEWYYHLSWLYMKYLEPYDYEHAAKLIIEVLQQHWQHLSEVQLQQLGSRGEQLKTSKKHKVDQYFHDTIAELIPKPIDIEIPQYTTDAKTIRDNESGRKRGYVVKDKEGNIKFLSVEIIALEHYIEERGYTDGRHCEGTLIKATFTLFFWDIIYEMELPGTFISKIQSEPLDMNTKYFYLRRKDAIDKRLKEIESEWSHSEIVKWLKDNYDLHSHELGFCEVGNAIENANLLEILVDCIGRQVLAKIYERFVKNIRHYRSGMPDLLVWNADHKKSKFVEVKGENDKLSIGQTLWLKYLRSIGADAEVCHVHSMGSKRKKGIKKAKGKDLAVPSTSSATN